MWWAFQAQGSGKVLKIRVNARATMDSLWATEVVWFLAWRKWRNTQELEFNSQVVKLVLWKMY